MLSSIGHAVLPKTMVGREDVSLLIGDDFHEGKREMGLVVGLF